jgi:hypothetical protein
LADASNRARDVTAVGAPVHTFGYRRLADHWQQRSGTMRAQRSEPARSGRRPMSEQRPVTLETLAAQALGEIGPVPGGLAPVINRPANYGQ